MEKRLLSAKEAGRYLGISYRTVWAWAVGRLVATTRLGRRVLFDRLQLDQFIEKSPLMTQRYAHHYPESLRDGVEVLEPAAAGITLYHSCGGRPECRSSVSTGKDWWAV